MIILDTNVLGKICHRSSHVDVIAIQDWLALLRDRKLEIAIPEIVDYELRRSLIRMDSADSLMFLDSLETDVTYLPLTTSIMRRAANLWAETRNDGRVTAPDAALDGDVILSAQAIEAENTGIPVLVVSTNLRHLKWFVNTESWEAIDPADPALDIHVRRFRS
jgi:predicted nucleic acid-binding protein